MPPLAKVEPKISNTFGKLFCDTFSKSVSQRLMPHLAKVEPKTNILSAKQVRKYFATLFLKV
jgi:hypothetical protein